MKSKGEVTRFTQSSCGVPAGSGAPGPCSFSAHSLFFPPCLAAEEILRVRCPVS